MRRLIAIAVHPIWTMPLSQGKNSNQQDCTVHMCMCVACDNNEENIFLFQQVGSTESNDPFGQWTNMDVKREIKQKSIKSLVFFQQTATGNETIQNKSEI